MSCKHVPGAVVVCGLTAFVLIFPAWAQRAGKQDTAWEELLRHDPEAADNPQIGWRERLILHVVTPEQARAYFQHGAEAESLLLEDGRTLKEYLDGKLSPPAGVYIALPTPCPLFSSDQLDPDTGYGIQVRGTDLQSQGGSPTGCGIPQEATAVILNLKLEGAEAGGRAKLWAADGPEPVESVLQIADGSIPTGPRTVVVALASDGQGEGELLVRGTASASVRGEVVGYFRAMRSGDGPGGGISLYTEGENNYFGTDAGGASGSWNSFFGGYAGDVNTGSSNSFFGFYAGTSNTTGYYNSFFGDAAGGSNTTGYSNSFFGYYAGAFNTTGNFNAFFGRGAGYSNTVEGNNTFIGSSANLDPGADPAAHPVTNATALGYRAYVSQSNSLVLGSINGVNDATADVKVGIGTTAPQEALHVVRSDGTAQILVQETSGTTANRVQFRLTNNGGPWFKLLNSATAKEWTFAMDSQDNFIFSLIGTGGSEFKIYKSGRVVMGPGGTSAFDLLPNGDLAIAGNLTAAGVTYVSDRRRKTNFTAVDSRRILEQVAAMEITRWNFKDDEKETPHLGPMAQDFYAAFGLGGDEKTISASDISGVALAAIQGLQEENAELKAEIRHLRSRVMRMELLEAEVQEIREMLRAAASGGGVIPGE